MRFRDLGELRVEADDLHVPLPGRRLPTVLARLLVAVGRTVSADSLVEAVWGDQPPARALQSLETVVWRLRSVLEPERAARTVATIVRKQGDGYLLAVTPDTVDSYRFTDLAERAIRALGASDPRQALALSESGLSLWRGDPYASLADAPWLDPVRQKLVERRLDLAACRVQALLDTGQPERALSAVLPLLEEEPFDERFWAQRMLGLYRTGRQTDALAAFGEARHLLSEELGIEPGPALRSLHAQVLQHASELDPPPLRGRTEDEPPLRLPSRRGVLIGREDALATLAERNGSHRVVTITGPGGVGKTRLAVEAGFRLRDRYPDGVWFVDLSAVRASDGNAARLREIVATTLELAPRTDIPVDRVLTESLRDRRLLLVIDNCEQVLEAISLVVDDILDTAPGVAVLATSREPLDIAGESVTLLSPLAPDDAMTLFVDLRASAGPDLAPLDDQDRSQILEICESVGGLPLGIELAAARARVFEVNEVVASLSDGVTGLSRSGRGPQRQASMLDTVDWSYRLARADEQILHRRLATLPGPVSVEAARVLCSVPPLRADQAPALVAGLVHRSLLSATRPDHRHGATTFRQLVPTRAHAARLLDPSERAAVCQVRDRWVVDTIRTAPLDGRAGQAEASAWVDTNETAVSATLTSLLVDASDSEALEMLARLTLYWFERGQLLNASHWYRAAVAAADSGRFSGTTAQLARVLELCARALSQDRPAATRIAAELPGLVNPATQLVPLVGEVLVLVGVSTWVAQTPDIGLPATRAAMAIGEQHALPHVQLRARALADMLHLRGPERPAAVADARHVLDDPLGNEFAAFVAAYLCSLSASMDGEPDAALAWAQRLTRAHQALAMHPTSELLEDLGGVLMRAARRTDAVRCLAAASAMYAKDGLPWPRLPHTAGVLDQLQRSLSTVDYGRLWRSGERLARSVAPSALLAEWFADAAPGAAGRARPIAAVG